MQKHLSFRSQGLFGKNKPPGNWSSAEAFSPKDGSVLKKRGYLFAVTTIKGPEGFDIPAVGKMVVETLEAEYYSTLDGAPLPVLESAVMKAHHRLLDLVHGTVSSKEGVDFNIVAAVLWGKILYLAKLGVGAVYLLRGEIIKEIGSVSEAQVSVASGIVNDKDILILGSPDFRTRFSTESLKGNIEKLEEQIQSSPENQNLAALLLSLFEEELPSEREFIKFVNPLEAVSKINKKKTFTPLLNLKVSFPKISLPRFFPIKTLTQKDGVVTGPAPSVEGLYLSNRSPSDRKAFRKKRFALLVFTVVVALSVFSIFSVKKQQEKKNAETLAILLVEIEKNILAASDVVDLNAVLSRSYLEKALADSEKISALGGKNLVSDYTRRINDLLTKANKAQASLPRALYDFSSRGEKSGLRSTFGTSNAFFISDFGMKRVYKVSNPSSDNISVETIGEGELNEPNIISGNAEALFGSDGDSIFKLLFKDSTLKKDIIPEITISGESIFRAYNSSLYVVNAEKGALYKYSPIADGFSSPTNWLKEKSSLSGVISMTIDGDIFLLYKNGDIKAFSTGKASEFSLAGLDKPFLNPTAIYTQPAFKSIYILDSGNKRIVLTDKNGFYKKQFLLSIEEAVKAVDLWVDDSEKYAYFITDKKLFQVDLSGDL